MVHEVDLRTINFSSYEELRNKFRWNIPEYFNIGEAILDRNIKEGFGDNIALYYEDEEGNKNVYTFSEIKKLSDSFIKILKERFNVNKGDVIGVYLQLKASLFRAGMKIHKTQEANKNLMMSTSDNKHMQDGRGFSAPLDCPWDEK